MADYGEDRAFAATVQQSAEDLNIAITVARARGLIVSAQIDHEEGVVVMIFRDLGRD